MKMFIITLLSLSVGFDFRDRKVPNEVILAGYLVGGIYRIIAAGSGLGIILFLRDAMVPVVLLYLLFIIRALGAGDIKLLSVIAGIIGIEDTLLIVGSSFAVGAVASAVKMAIHREIAIAIRTAVAYLGRIIKSGKIEKYPEERRDSKNTIHFTLAIAVGYVIVLGRDCFEQIKTWYL